MLSSEKIPWIKTPLVRSTTLSRAVGCNVYLKLENLQPSGSFKSRGIGNFLVSKLGDLHSDNRNCASSNAHFYSSSGGNAGLGCVHAAVTLGCEATIVVPLTTTEYMISKLKEAGATGVIQHGASWQEADGYLKEIVMAEAHARGEAAIYVPPFDAPEIWDGNANIVRETAQQLGEVHKHYHVYTNAMMDEGLDRPSTRLDAIVCSVGGGGLFCGVMQGLDEVGFDETRVVALETHGADSLAQAVAKGELVTLPAITSIATSLGARTVCRKALEYGLRDNVSTVVLSDAEAIEACRKFANDERVLVEPACGVCAAICYNGQLTELVPNFSRESVVVLVICGGSNISFEIMEQYAGKKFKNP